MCTAVKCSEMWSEMFNVMCSVVMFNAVKCAVQGRVEDMFNVQCSEMYSEVFNVMCSNVQCSEMCRGAGEDGGNLQCSVQQCALK